MLSGLLSCLTIVLKAKLLKVNKEAKIRKRYNQALNLTQDNTWESDKNTVKHHIQQSH